MKLKLLFLILTIVASFEHLSAQSYDYEASKERSKIYCSLGVLAGLDASSLKSSDASISPSSGMSFGFNGGVAFNVRFLRRNARSTAETGVLAIQPEIKYAMAGCKLEETSLNLGYLMIPVMLQVYPTKSLYIEAGPEIALNVSHSPDNFVCGNSQLNVTNLKANDVMLGLGIGMNIKGFTVGARYNMGFSKIAQNLPWKNSVIQLNLGYFFGFARKTKINIDSKIDL